jgi:tetratricopeptide (TPR) repeat protein
LNKEVFMRRYFEYRKDKYKKDTYNLYVDGKATGYRIFGAPMKLPEDQIPTKTLWLGNVGLSKEERARPYLSLEAAFHWESALAAQIYWTKDLHPIAAPPGENEHKDEGGKAAVNSFAISLEEWTNGHPSHPSGNSRSIQELNWAIESNPSHIDEYFGRAQAYTKKLDPAFVKAYLKRGEAFYNKKNYKRSIDDYNHVIKLGIKDPHAYYNLGCAYYKNGEFDSGIASLDAAIGINPNIAEVWNDHGILCMAKGDYDRAVKDFDKTIKLNPDLEDAYKNREIALHKKHE